MSIPAHLAVNVRPEDYHWHPLEPLPAQPVVPPTLPSMTISSVPITAEELAERMNKYVADLTSRPNWQEELAKKNLATREARKLARKLNRGKQ